ncbi:C-GCAxxG-C-C family protein [Gemmatimonadota bacterium]
MTASSVSRRDFIHAAPLAVLLGPASLSWQEALDTQQEDKRVGFAADFTEAEARLVAGSPMAQEIAGLNGQGYPCSEMILLAALRYMELPEKYLDSAAVFGGGVGKRDLCGLLTGGLMAIGFAAGEKYEDRSEMHRAGRQLSNEYWDWWISRGDVHCMGSNTTHENSDEFVRMCQRAAVRVEQLLRSMRST